MFVFLHVYIYIYYLYTSIITYNYIMSNGARDSRHRNVDMLEPTGGHTPQGSFGSTRNIGIHEDHP